MVRRVFKKFKDGALNFDSVDPSSSKALENSRKDPKGNDKTRRHERSNSLDIPQNLNQLPAGRDKQRKREKAAPTESEKPVGRGRQQEKNNNNSQTQPSKELPYKDVLEIRDTPVENVTQQEAPKPRIPEPDSQTKNFRLKANVESEDLVKEITERILDQLVELTLRDILGSSRNLRESVRGEIATKRVPVQTKRTTLEEVEDEDAPKVKVPLRVIQVKLAKKEDLPELEVKISQSPMGKMPVGSVYVSDPIEQFLVTGRDNDSIVVAKESQGLQLIYLTINGVEEVESVVDGGSQIVSMALDVVMTLRVSWDPRYTINLQSANKGVE